MEKKMETANISESLWKRLCPLCSGSIQYSTQLIYDIATKVNAICYTCVQANPTKVALVAYAPISKLGENTIKNNNKKPKIIYTEEELSKEKEWCRQCPKCYKKIYHYGDNAHNNMKLSKKLGRLCGSCAQTGEGNLWIEESKKKFSKSRIGKNNPNYRHGKTCGWCAKRKKWSNITTGSITPSLI
jgi:hypothetical protein